LKKILFNLFAPALDVLEVDPGVVPLEPDAEVDLVGHGQLFERADVINDEIHPDGRSD
jgi:hypothetical protein